MTTVAVRLIAVSIFLAAPAYGDTIGRLADGASCRDGKGVVRQPPVRPSAHAEVQRAPPGMLKTSRDVGGAACFFYIQEIAITESPSECPSAETASSKSSVSGTLASCPKR